MKLLLFKVDVIDLDVDEGAEIEINMNEVSYFRFKLVRALLESS